MSEVQPIRYSLRDAARILGISRMRLYERIREGCFATIRDGRDRYVLREEVERYAREEHPHIERHQRAKRSREARAGSCD